MTPDHAAALAYLFSLSSTAHRRAIRDMRRTRGIAFTLAVLESVLNAIEAEEIDVMQAGHERATP